MTTTAPNIDAEGVYVSQPRTATDPAPADRLPVLHKLITEAHQISAHRDNPSSIACALTAKASGRYQNAICAAILATGGPHAPIEETHNLIFAPGYEEVTEAMISIGQKVPGWGNSFVKGGPDPIWAPVHGYLDQWFPEEAKRLADITAILHRAGKRLYPNPSAYTAVAGHIFGMAPKSLPGLFIACRLSAWNNIFLQSVTA